jgi:hypothetical protein
VASKPKKKMPAKQRAKQFLPFAAVQGLEPALKRKEEEVLKASPHSYLFSKISITQK